MPDPSQFDDLNKLIGDANPANIGKPGGLPDDKIVVQSEVSYWVQSRQPLASLFFILPFLVVYEVGVLLQGPDQLRNGADVWLRQLITMVFGPYYFLLPLLIVVILLAWHHLTEHRWKISRNLLTGMFVESLILAGVLVMIAKMQGRWFPFSIGETLHDIVSFFGAGVYEEMLFRLMLLPATAWIFRAFGMKKQSPWFVAAVVTSLLFAAAHHIGSTGEPIALRPFVFRSVAGMFFCLLFLYRRFGISVGTHAIYDILVGVL